MLYEFSLPSKSNKVPAGQEWIHEIKYDGCRMAATFCRLVLDRRGRGRGRDAPLARQIAQR
jgi:hypothetical protein